MKEIIFTDKNFSGRCYGENIYNKVGNEKRLALLDMVKLQGKTLKEASNLLRINYSTAKTILRVYRIENRILKKSPNPNKIKRKCRLYEKDDSQNEIKTTNKNYNCTFNNNQEKKTEITPNNYVNCFKILVNNLKVCVSEVMKNDLKIKNICCFFQNNIPQFQFRNFNLPEAFPCGKFFSIDHEKDLKNNQNTCSDSNLNDLIKMNLFSFINNKNKNNPVLESHN